MYKAWIVYTILAGIYFIICLIILVFYNKPVFENYWEESLLLLSIINLGTAFSYYRKNKHEITARWGKNYRKTKLSDNDENQT